MMMANGVKHIEEKHVVCQFMKFINYLNYTVFRRQCQIYLQVDGRKVSKGGLWNRPVKLRQPFQYAKIL